MKVKKLQPDFYIYNPAETEMLGKVIAPQDVVIDYNFNAASKVTFSVNKRIYDERIGKWIDNPCYDNLVEHKVVVSTDTKQMETVKDIAINEECERIELNCWLFNTNAIDAVARKLNSLTANVTITSKEASGTLKVGVKAAAKGNVRNYSVGRKHAALAGGTTPTLMGELGPEMVVSNGHYYVVG